MVGPLSQLPLAAVGGRGARDVERRPAEPAGAWATAYDDAIAAAPDGDYTKVRTGRLRPGTGVPAAELAAAQAGALDGIVQAQGDLNKTDDTDRCCSSPTGRTWRTRRAPSTWAATSGG